MNLIFSIMIMSVCVCLGKQATTTTTKATTKTTTKTTTRIATTTKSTTKSTTKPPTTTSPINLNNIMQKLLELEDKLNAINSCACRNSTPATPFPPTTQPPPPISRCLNNSNDALKQTLKTNQGNFLVQFIELANDNLAVGSWGYSNIITYNLTTGKPDITLDLRVNCNDFAGLSQMVILPNGNLAAITSDYYCSNHSVSIWDLKTGSLVNNFPMPYQPMSFLLLQNGNLLLHLWSDLLVVLNPINGTILMRRQLYLQSSLAGRVLLPNGNILLGFGSNPDLQIWDSKNLTLIKTISAKIPSNTNQTISYNVDLKVLPNNILAASSSTKILFWSLDNGTLVGSIDYEYDYNPYFSLLSNGYLALAHDQQVNIYDTMSRRLKKTICNYQNASYWPDLTYHGIRAIATLRNGNLVTANMDYSTSASSYTFGLVYIWNIII